MKASDYKRGWNGERPYDELVDFIDSDQGKKRLDELDGHWSDVMELAERYGFIVQTFGGTATIATHGAFVEELGADDEARRLRMCDVDMEMEES